MKTIFFRLVAISLMTIASSNSQATTPGYTIVFFANNTSRPLKIEQSSGNPQSIIMSQRTANIAPGERVELMRISRYTNVRFLRNYTVSTRVQFVAPRPGDSAFDLREKVTGTFTSSNLALSADRSGSSTQWIYDGRVMSEISGGSYDKEHPLILYGQFTKPLQGVFGNIEYSLSEVEIDQNPNVLNIWQYNIQQRPSTEGLSHNVTNVLTNDGESIFSERSTLSTMSLPRAVNHFDPKVDVISVNEAFTASLQPELRANFERFGFRYATQVLNKNRSLGWSGGVMVMSKYPIIASKDYQYTHAAGADEHAAKGVQYVQINKAGRVFHIFATHTNASYDFAGKTRLDSDDEGRLARREQFREIRIFVQSQRIPTDQPILFIGDINVDMISEGRNSGSEYLDMLRTLDATHPNLAGYPYSLDLRVNQWVNPDDGPAQLLDYIMFENRHKTPSRAVNEVICLKEDGTNSCTKTDRVRDLSDHFPVRGLFEFF